MGGDALRAWYFGASEASASTTRADYGPNGTEIVRQQEEDGEEVTQVVAPTNPSVEYYEALGLLDPVPDSWVVGQTLVHTYVDNSSQKYVGMEYEHMYHRATTAMLVEKGDTIGESVIMDEFGFAETIDESLDIRFNSSKPNYGVYELPTEDADQQALQSITSTVRKYLQ